MGLIALRAIAANILVMVAVFGFGSRISRLLPDTFSLFTRLLCAMTGGFGLLGLTIFLVGHVALNRWTIGAILAIGVALAIFSKERPWELRVPITKLPAAIVIAVLLATVGAGLAEPVGDWGKDGVAYHLVGPKVWLRNGVIRPIPDNMNTSYPSTGEMVFTAMWAFGGDRAPGLSSVWTLALLLGIAASLGRRCGIDARGAWWIAALVATMPAVYAGSHSAFVDVIYATFILVAARLGLDATEKRHYVAFGIFCGLAMATKYPAFLAVPVLILCAVRWRENKDRSYREWMPNAAVAAVVACIVAAPIYLKNWILLGTPLYPPPASVAKYLHVKYFPTEAIRAFYQYNIERGKGHGRGLLHFFTLPFNLTYHTADFSGAGGIGLAPLAFGPLGVLASWREAFARRLALVSLLLLALWFATMQESRYLIHFYTLSAVFAVFGWQMAVAMTGRRGKMLCAAAIAISLAYGSYMMGIVDVPDCLSVVSPGRGQARHRAGIPFVESFDYLNSDSGVTRLLILDVSVPAYYSDKDYVKPFGQWGERVFPRVNTTADVLPKLKELGISHVLDVQSTVAGYQVPANYPGLQLVFQAPGQRVYKVVSP